MDGKIFLDLYDVRAQLTDDVKVGARIEVELESNSSARIDQNDNTPVNRTFAERKAEDL